MGSFQRKLSAVDAVFAPLSDPYGSIKHFLVERERPPYLLVILLAVLAISLGPVVWYQLQFNIPPRDSELNAAVVATVAGTAMLFILSNTVFLTLLGISVSLPQMLAATCYSLTPIIPLMLGLYAASYALDGHASLVEYLAIGGIRQTDRIFEFLPYAFIVAAGYMCVVFLNCIRVLGKASILTSFFVTAACAIVFFGSFFASLSMTEVWFPGYSHQVESFFASLTGPTQAPE